MKPVILAAFAAVSLVSAGVPAIAAPYRLDRLHDREDRIQDAVDQRRRSTRVGDELIGVRKLEEHMRARHGGNLTRRDFAILDARLDALEGRRRRAYARHAAARRGPASITTTTTTVRR